MIEHIRKSWLRRRIEDGLQRGFQHAYETVKVDPSKFLLQLRAAYGLPVSSFQGVYSVEVAHLDDVARRIIRSGMKIAAAEGAGLGMGGLITISAFWPVSLCAQSRNSVCFTVSNTTRTRRLQSSGLPPPAPPGLISVVSCWKKGSSSALCPE